MTKECRVLETNQLTPFFFFMELSLVYFPLEMFSSGGKEDV